MNYGMPYMGSKSTIVKKLCEALPAADNFYDLFGGGGAVTDYVLKTQSHKWPNVIYNEIEKDVCDLFKRATSGEFNYDIFKPKWISREDFFANKATCAYTRCVLSFGNYQKTYIFGNAIEENKRSLHQAVVFGEFNDFAKDALQISRWPDEFTNIKERRLFCRRKIIARQGELQQLQQLEQLEQLERLERLQQLEQLERLQLYHIDYADVTIKPNSIIYCDIPYKGTCAYLQKFDYDRFFNWVANNKTPVFISEFNINDSRFKEIWQTPKKQKLSQNSKSKTCQEVIERIYANAAGLEYISAKTKAESA